MSTGAGATSADRARIFLIVGRTRFAVLDSAGSSLTTGFGAGDSGFSSGFGAGWGLVTGMFSTRAGGGNGSGGKSRASELVNTSAPRPKQTSTTKLATTPSARILFLDGLRCK